MIPYSLYAEASELRLGTGSAVQALLRVGGNGSRRPRCLLLHGNPGSLEDWQEIVPRLSGVADVLAIDLPGSGEAPGPVPKRSL